ncbi:MAG: acetolactate synthase large subunit [Maritimibacter sp.]|nr:acetolactate synthase large subunit [Maritimibacter sp.]
MMGAESLVRTLVAGGVDTCFANPGTSEMHFVSALDRVPEMRCVLCLFEGVATGAADGYARMTGRPAATLLHLGPGLANGLSNLHNAKRAQSAVVNVIGDHATGHRQLDAPLTSDIEGAARPFSDWVRTSPNADAVATDGAAAIAAARSLNGRVASLILPADTAWTPLSPARSADTRDGVAPVPAITPPAKADPDRIAAAVEVLRRDEATVIFLTGEAVRDPLIDVAGRIAAATGADLMTPTQCPVISRGAGRPEVTRLPYPIAQAVEALSGYRNVLLLGAKAPVSFFAYPGRPGELVPPGVNVQKICGPEDDIADTLTALCNALGANEVEPARAPLDVPAQPSGEITPESLGPAIAAAIPDNAIVIDESLTSGRSFMGPTSTARPHDWVLGTGGSIGYALPNAIGAAIACPDRKVICLESDGSGMYMPQALWTMAREKLPILIVIFANRKYQILRAEMTNVGAQIGPSAASLLDIDQPTIDWTGLARSLSVEAEQVTDLDALNRALAHGVALDAPYLVEVVL